MKNILVILVLLSFLVLPAIGLTAGEDLIEPPDVKILGQGGVLDQIINYLFTILLIVAVIFIIIAGFYFVTGVGDPEKYTKARMMLLYALIGVLVAISAKGLVILIVKIAGEEGAKIESCGAYCKVQGKSEGNCAPECWPLWGENWPDGDSFCPSTAPKCCCQ